MKEKYNNMEKKIKQEQEIFFLEMENEMRETMMWNYAIDENKKKK